MEDGRSTVTVTQDGFKSMADARCTVSGTFEIVPDDERAAAREAYMKVHPHAPREAPSTGLVITSLLVLRAFAGKIAGMARVVLWNIC